MHSRSCDKHSIPSKGNGQTQFACADASNATVSMRRRAYEMVIASFIREINNDHRFYMLAQMITVLVRFHK